MLLDPCDPYPCYNNDTCVPISPTQADCVEPPQPCSTPTGKVYIQAAAICHCQEQIISSKKTVCKHMPQDFILLMCCIVEWQEWSAWDESLCVETNVRYKIRERCEDGLEVYSHVYDFCNGKHL